MRLVSPVALALMMALAGSSLVAVSSAHAAKKDEQPAAPKLKVTPALLKAAKPLSEAIAKKDAEAGKAALAALEALVVSNDDRYFVNSFKFNLSLVTKDADMQGQAANGMLESGLLPESDIGQTNFVASKYDLSQKQFDSAIAKAQASLAAGYGAADNDLTLAQAYWGKAGEHNLKAEPQRSLVAQGLTAFKAGIDARKAIGAEVPDQWYEVAVGKADAAGLPSIGEWAQLAYANSPSGKNLRNVLAVYQRLTPSLSAKENLDVLRLMYAADGMELGTDYQEYAQTAFKTGVFGEVKSAIDAGRASGKLSGKAGDDVYGLANQQIAHDRSTLPASEAQAGKAATGKIAAATGDGYLGYANYPQAATLYRLALTKGGVDADEVNTHLGIALALSGDKAGARDALAKVTGGNRAQIAKYWLLWLDSKTPA